MTAENRLMSRLFPSRRLNTDFPWPVWALGWMSILKGLIWLATDPNLPDPLLRIVGFQHLILLVPFVVGGIGVWHRKKWAMWLTVGAVITDLAGYLIYPGALAAFRNVDPSLLSKILGGALFVVNGPLGGILILIGVPFVLRWANHEDQGKKIAKTP